MNETRDDSANLAPPADSTFSFNASGVRTGLVAFVLLALGFAAGAVLVSSRSVSRDEVAAMIQNALGGQQTAAGGAAASALTDDDPSFGPVDAPVTIVEFSDFYCPRCTDFVNQTLPRLRERYGDNIRFIYRDLPIIGGAASVAAAIAGTCAHQQDKFWPFHDLLFANFDARDREIYVGFAGEVGMDTEVFRTCLDEEASLDEVTLDWVDGEGLGIRGTPFFYINSRMIAGAMPYDVFALVIDTELEQLGITPPDA